MCVQRTRRTRHQFADHMCGMVLLHTCVPYAPVLCSRRDSLPLAGGAGRRDSLLPAGASGRKDSPGGMVRVWLSVP